MRKLLYERIANLEEIMNFILKHKEDELNANETSDNEVNDAYFMKINYKYRDVEAALNAKLVELKHRYFNVARDSIDEEEWEIDQDVEDWEEEDNE